MWIKITRTQNVGIVSVFRKLVYHKKYSLHPPSQNHLPSIYFSNACEHFPIFQHRNIERGGSVKEKRKIRLYADSANTVFLKTNYREVY